MPVLTGIGQLLTCGAAGGQGELHPVIDAALAWEDGVLRWVGPRHDLPRHFARDEVHDAGGRLVAPGLVDCHTHLAFGGWRADELELRLGGASYLDIARRGGGIQRTVRQTRQASDDELVCAARRHLDAMARLGITTVECKSGYGLSVAEELRLLRLYRRLGEEQPLRLVSTLLGAHVVPPEYRQQRGKYVDLVCKEMIPAAAEDGLASFCDVFVEEGAFSADEARRILDIAAGHGMRGKLHVDQLHDVGGGELAAETGCVSADHLEYVSDAGIAAMAAVGVVAVNLPLAAFYLRQPSMPARRLVEAGVAVAVSTDFNPGTAPSHHLPLALLLSAVSTGLKAAEVLKGATLVAARALGLEDSIGSLEPGKRADFLVIEAPDVEHWLYHFQANAVAETWIGGQRIVPAPEIRS